jgi:hypothetical protein
VRRDGIYVDVALTHGYSPYEYIVNCPTLSYMTQQIRAEPLGVLFLVHGATADNYIVTQVATQLRQDFTGNDANVSMVL